MAVRSHAFRWWFVVVAALGLAMEVPAAHAGAIGAQLGMDRSGVDGDTPPNSAYTDKIGLVAGLQGEIHFAHDLLLSLQPSLVQKKSGILIAPSTRGGANTELDLSFDSFSVPVLVKFAKAGGRTYFAGGVSADFLTGATLSGQGVDRDVKPAFSSTGVGAVLGFGVVFPAKRASFTTELRFVQGISNMTKGTVAEATGALAPRLHSSGLQLIVGSLLPVGQP
jgi:hypothetical protein